MTLPPGRLRFADQTILDRIIDAGEDDRDLSLSPSLGLQGAAGLGGLATIAVTCLRDLGVGRQCRQSIVLTFRPAVINANVTILEITDLAQALAEVDSGDQRKGIG